MKILVSEFITGGGLIGESLPTPLLQEGRLMLDAIVSDLGEIDNIEVFITYEERIVQPDLPDNCNAYLVKENYRSSLQEFCLNVDAVLIVAPESDGCLEQLTQLVVKEDKLLLGSYPSVINLTASKNATALYLAEKGSKVIKTSLYDSNSLDEFTKDDGKACVVKPDNGVGCEEIYVCRSADEIIKAVSHCERAILQPKLEGISASISLLCIQGECLVLGYNEQIIKVDDNKISLVRLKVNALLKFKQQLDQLANEVCSVLPQLNGYVGLDVIITQDEVVLVEINPRLTTSYVGLRESINTNPAQLLLDMIIKKKLPTLDGSKFKMVTVNI